MKSCREFQSMFIEAYYGEIQPYHKDQLEKHLAICQHCKESYAELGVALDKASEYKRKSLPDEYWQQYWERLKPKLATMTPQPRQKESKSFHWQLPNLNLRMAAAIAATVILFIATLVIFRPSRFEDTLLISSDSAIVDEVRESINSRVSRYLNRSRVILMSLVNLEDDEVDEIDFQQQQEFSTALLSESKILRQQLSPHDRIMTLVNDLDMVMMQIANQDPYLDKEGVDLIRSSVENKELLFKINVEKMVFNKPTL